MALLHNLVVSPVKGKGKKERYQIVSGSRRFEALRLLEERGELPEDFTVAVEVRDDLSKDQTLRIATVENLQRQNMTPLEEAAALTKLVHKGVTLDDVVAQTGLSATTIKRRLALNSLCREAKAALAKGEITLSQAEALTLGSDEAQRSILEQIESGDEFSAEDIKATLLDDRPTVALAIFPAENTPAPSPPTCLPRTRLRILTMRSSSSPCRRRPLRELVKHHEASAAWVEVTRGSPHSRLAVPQGAEEPEGRRPYQSLALGPGRDQGRSGQAQDREGDRQGDCGEPGSAA